MNKKEWILGVLYYVLVAILFLGALGFCSMMLNVEGGIENLGLVIFVTYAFMFLATPVLVAAAMRFSLLRWYIDPFAAAEIPLLLILLSVSNQMNRAGMSFAEAFAKVNADNLAEGAAGWLFYLGLLGFGLILSYSPARRNGANISHRLVKKWFGGESAPAQGQRLK